MNIFSILKQMFGSKNEIRTIPTECKPSSDVYLPNHNDIRLVAGDDVLIITDDKQIGGLWVAVDNYDPCSGSYKDCFESMTKLIKENFEEACESLAFKLEEHLYLINLADCINTSHFDDMSSFNYQLLECKMNVFYPIIKHFVEQHCSDKKVGLVNLFGGGTSLAMSLIYDRLKEEGYQCYVESGVFPFQNKKIKKVPEGCFNYKNTDDCEEFDVNPFYDKNITLVELLDNKVPLLLQAMIYRVNERLSHNVIKTDNMNTSNFDIQRFIDAQNKFNTYDLALSEVRNGKKRSHWIWFIFPQIQGLGHSNTSRMYGIKSLAEAKDFLKNETLKNRLYEITNALLAQEESAIGIFGGLDAMKVRSCMTLFNLVSPNDVFAKVLDKFYDGETCKRTLAIVKEEQEITPTIQYDNCTYANVVRPKYTPDKIDSLKQDEVFVFGSNLQGRHAGGAARAARLRFGAIMGQGVGLQGQSYAIPTMQGGVETIKPYVDEFIEFAKNRTDLFFYVTRIGCGIAGFKDEQIAPLFAGALDIENICLPQSFVKILKPEVPQELMAMMHGQIRTLIDVLKALNDDEPIKDCNDAQKRLTEIVERNVRYGDEFAFMAIRTLWSLTRKYQHEGNGVDIDRLERDMNSFHDFNHYAQEPITKIMYGYSVRKMIKYIQFLNEFRRYKDYESIKEDLHSIPFSHCSSNDEHYYFSFYPGIMWRVFDILLEEHDFLFNRGTLDNELLEEAAFNRFDRVVAKYGLEETINLAYGDLGCHPDLKGPMPSCGGSVWGPYYRVRDGIIEKGCSDFRRWPFSNTSFEMRFATQILDKDPNYLHKQGDWHGDLFIPIEDYTLPVYYSRSGKVTFKNDSEKREFIELHKQDPNAGRVQE